MPLAATGRPDRPDGAANEELDRQVANLLGSGYPGLAGLGTPDFLALVAPLRDRLPEIPAGGGDQAMAKVRYKGKAGYVNLYPKVPDDFQPLPGLGIPDAPVYLALDVDTGRETLNVTPAEALDVVETAGRLPLTIDEGVALLTHFPDILKTRNAYSILGSRCGDRRVPAIWLSGGKPRLGWCWAGNPHTWLGSASCSGRLGTVRGTARL